MTSATPSFSDLLAALDQDASSLKVADGTLADANTKLTNAQAIVDTAKTADADAFNKVDADVSAIAAAWDALKKARNAQPSPAPTEAPLVSGGPTA